MQFDFKEIVYQRCQQVLSEKIILLQNTLLDLRNSAANETKSTAGDKHETALAMLQIEQENTGRQLRNLLDQQRELLHMDVRLKPLKIIKGSIIVTNQGTFFIAISLGKLQVNDENIIVISAQSPLAQSFAGRKQGDSFELNSHQYTVISFS